MKKFNSVIAKQLDERYETLKPSTIQTIHETSIAFLRDVTLPPDELRNEWVDFVSSWLNCIPLYSAYAAMGDYSYDQNKIGEIFIDLLDELVDPADNIWGKTAHYPMRLANRIAYHTLTRLHPNGQDLLKALDIPIWNKYVNNPSRSELNFVGVLLNNFMSFWDVIRDRLHHLPVTETNITDTFAAVGISKSRIVKFKCPDSKLTVNQLIPHLQWNEVRLDYAELSLEAKSITRYFSGNTKHNVAMRRDIATWLSQYPKWIDNFTYFEHNVGTDEEPNIVSTRIHHHNLMDFLELPYRNGKVDLKKHPKDWFVENMPEGLKELLRKTHDYLNLEFKFNNDLLRKIEEHYPEGTVHLLRTAQDLVNEGDSMECCVGGLSYVQAAHLGECHFYHLDTPDLDGRGITVQIINKDDDGNPTNLPFPWEVKGYKNRDTTSNENALIAQLLANLYLDRFNLNNNLEMTN